MAFFRGIWSSGLVSVLGLALVIFGCYEMDLTLTTICSIFLLLCKFRSNICLEDMHKLARTV